MKRNAWYQRSVGDVFEHLATSRDGLGPEEVKLRQERDGANEIIFKTSPIFIRFLRQLKDPMVYVLLVAGSITGALTLYGAHLLPDTIVIFGVIFFNAILGFIQTEKAEEAIAALEDMMTPECVVIRAGQVLRIESRDLVVGDIVLLEAGDCIPADLRFFEESNLYVDEAPLTGESNAVNKTTAPLDGQDIVYGDQRNMGFSGTYLVKGTGKGIVVETARETAFGKIAKMMADTDIVETPLQKKLSDFIHTLIKFILLVGTINFGIGMWVGLSWEYSFMGAVSLIVAVIPEMLPALVTAILALAAARMATLNAIVRDLPAAETLGCVQYVCSDKTGTLTKNKMTVTKVWDGVQVFDVTGTGYSPEGAFFLAGNEVKVANHPSLNLLLETGFFCNNAHVKADGSLIGDPTEGALKTVALKGGIADEGAEMLEELPFESATKYMATLHQLSNGKKYIFVKGAPEVVLKMCTNQLDANTHPVPVDEQAVLAIGSSFTGDALRTLGFAFKEVDLHREDFTHEDLKELIFCGLQGMIDPPRESAIQAVSEFKTAGIKTIMITGDHPQTALAIARQLGIDAQKVLVGSQLEVMTDEELTGIVTSVNVYARVSPEHKLRIAQAFQSNGKVVAMTGDGVNDATALKGADIGVCMGITGTAVAKSASNMILADDNIYTMVKAVEEGRHSWNNLLKAILYTLPTNAAQGTLVMGALLMANFIPLFATRFVLEPIQILWVNLLDSVFLTMPLMMEAKEKGLLLEPPRDPKIRIINAMFVQRVAVVGLAIAFPGFFIYYYFGAPALDGNGGVNQLLLTQAQTAAFWAILFAHLGYVVSARSIHKSFFTFNPLGNKWLLGGVAMCILIRFIPNIFPPVAALFKTAPFPMAWWPLILLSFLPSFITIELLKLRSRISQRA